MASFKRIIAVLGSTGNQGGALVEAILADKSGQFVARAITRNPDSDKGKALKARGVEVVAADMENVESLKTAFTGAYGAFVVTQLAKKAEIETQQAKNAADAAKAVGVKHVIWSSLDDTRKLIPLSDNRMPTIDGKYKVPYFDAKADASEYYRKIGVPFTELLTPGFWDNYTEMPLIHKEQDGNYSIKIPMGNVKMAGICAEDIGKCALGIFKAGNKYIGKTVGISGDQLTGIEIAAKFSKALGKDIKYIPIEPDVFRSFPMPMAVEIGNMFQYYRDFSEQFCASRDVNLSRKLNPELKTFDQWLDKHKAEIKC